MSSSRQLVVAIHPPLVPKQTDEQVFTLTTRGNASQILMKYRVQLVLGFDMSAGAIMPLAQRECRPNTKPGYDAPSQQGRASLQSFPYQAEFCFSRLFCHKKRAKSAPRHGHVEGRHLVDLAVGALVAAAAGRRRGVRAACWLTAVHHAAHQQS